MMRIPAAAALPMNLLALAAALLTPAWAWAQEPALGETTEPVLEQSAPPPDTRLTIATYVDNDGPLLSPFNDSDRWYTSGAGISVSWPLQASTTVPWLPFDGEFHRRALGVIAGQQIYTPEVITTRTPDPDDRPYAGYLYGGLFYQRANDDTLDHFELDMGVVGPSSLAEKTQKTVHEVFEGDDPRGWDSQIEDEFAIQLYLRRKWRAGIDLGGQWTLQGIPQVGLALGTVQRHAEAGVLGRIGFRLPDDFGPGRLQDPTTAATADPDATQRGFHAYAFTRLGGRAVEHNTFVEGSEFNGGPGVDEEPLVGEAQFGFALGWNFDRASAEVSWAQTYVTDEFEGQDHTTAYGSINVRLTLLF